MSCPGTYPAVLNGQISSSSSSSAEYECLSGFYMTGSKVITCSSGVWQTAPTCNVIDQADDVFPDWWLIVAAAVLGLLVLICLFCVICYYCCGRSSNTIHPGDNVENGCCGGRCGCCRSGCCGRESGCGCCASGTGCLASCCLMGGNGGCCLCRKTAKGKKKRGKAGQGNTGKGGGGKGGKGKEDGGQTKTTVITTPPQSHVAIVPAPSHREKKKSPPPPVDTTSGSGHYVFIPADGDVKSTPPHQHTPKDRRHSHNVIYHSSGTGGHAHIPHGHAHAPNGHGHAPNGHGHAHGSEGQAYIVQSPTGSGAATPCSCCGPSGPQGGGWILVRDAMTHKSLQNSDGVELEVLETDGEPRRSLRTKKPPAKDIKAWLPHSNPIRSINTSTK